MATLLYMLKITNMELPYDLSLSHHQLLFNAIAFILYSKYVNSFSKNKQNDKFTLLVDCVNGY